MVHEKTYVNKAQYFVWFQAGDAKISDIFQKIQKFQKRLWALVITANGINFLIARPL